MITSAALQAQLGLVPATRCIGTGARNLQQRRLHRVPQRLARPAVAAAEVEVPSDAPAADPAPVTAQSDAPPPKRQQQQQQRRRRPSKPAYGPDRTINLEDLSTDVSYEAHIVSVTNFGAFVNIGAKTDGLLHISQISSDFVSNVADVVSPGDVVQVRVLNVDLEKQKFAVTALDQATQASRQARRDAAAERQAQGEDAGQGGPQGKPRQARAVKSSRGGGRDRRPACPYAIGETVTAVVKSVVPYGVFVSLGDSWEAMLHSSQMKLPEGVADHMGVFKEGETLEGLRVMSVGARGQERLRVSQLSPEEQEQMEIFMTKGAASIDELPPGSGAMGFAFAKAGISAEMFQSRAKPAAETPVKAAVEEPAAATAEPAKEAPAPAPVAAEAKPAEAKPAAGGISATLVKQLRDASGAGMMDCKKALGECGGDIEAAKEWLRKKGLASADKKAGRVASEGAVWSYIHAGSRLGVLVEVNCETDFVARGEKFKELVNDMAMQVAACPQVTVVSSEDVPAEVLQKERAIEMEKEDLKSKPEAIREKIVQGRVDKIAKELALLEQPYIKDTGKTVAEIVKEAVAQIGENIQIRRFVKYSLGEGIEVADKGDFAAEVEAQTAAMAAKAAEKKAEEAPAPAAAAEEEKKPAVAVSAALVKQLRDASGAGMMDCKKALGECGGDVEAAKEWLRKKGLASADKKAGRVASEGAVWSYIHAGSRLGVLVEVNCETDFVARGEKFKELVNDMAMQVAACPEVRFVSASDVPAAVLEKERAIEMEKEDLKSKPEAIREKIVQGRVDKIAKEFALLEQPFIKDTNKTVAEHIKEQIASIGENMGVRRFERFVLGEGLEKKVNDFAAEVAAQTGGKA